MNKAKVRDGKESVVHTRFRTAAEKVAAQGTVEDHYGADKMVTCGWCGKTSFLARRHGPAENPPGNQYSELRAAAVEAVQPTAAETMIFVAAEAARRGLSKAEADLSALRGRLSVAAGKPVLDRHGARIMVDRDERLLADGRSLETEAQRMLVEAEQRHRAAVAAKASAERALARRRVVWVQAQEAARTAAVRAKGGAADDVRRAGLRDRIAAVVARKE